MPHHLDRRRYRALTGRAALLAAAALAASGLVASLAAPAHAETDAAPAEPAAIDTLDYLADTYGIEDAVIETVTFERFEFLLQQEGRFAFLIGGPDDPTTVETIGTIDEVAKAAGVDAVYTFNPKLDGDRLDIRTTANADVAPLWTRLVTEYLSKDVQTPFDGTDDPYLFVYDRSHTADGGAEDRIVSALTAPVASGALADPTARDAYRTSVAAVLGSGDDLDAIDQFTFYRDVVNAKHASAYGGLTEYGGSTILDEADADWRVQGITYPELVDLFESDGDHVLLLGGTWCHNTRAVLKHANEDAVANGVETVYFFDLRLDGASGNDLHIRDTGSEFADFYGDLVTEFLPQLKTQYVTNGSPGQRVDFYPGGDTTQPLATAQKLQVPFLIEYDGDREVGGEPAPVARQWIHDNGDGTYREYMTEWWYVIDQPGRYASRPDPVALEAQLVFADEAISALDEFFAGLPRAGGGVEPTDPPVDPTDPPVDPTDPPVDPTTVKGSVAVTGSLRPGGTITVAGSGLAAGTPGFAVELHSEPQSLGTVATDASGAFSLTATIPAGTPAGAHRVVVLIGGVEVASADVTVASASATSGSNASSTSAGSGLASTGAGFTGPLLGAAAALVAAAGIALAVVRLRTRTRSES
ncbi:IPT/TIG domain-containing protein [Agromyces sp. LHK192]|uniref:IPT/TIG domain-containing protein n=1 Tax=Agromyces sp. LHK192 TaxID=2498704 RepID=UPI000FD7BFE4|nr:IPT/TIG domain-containing protein [Agromyces sp. LHK192]